MTHLTWLSLCVEKVSEDIGNSPFVLLGLPNLTHLNIDAAHSDSVYGEYPLSSITLRLPALQTLELQSDYDEDMAECLYELDLECPSLAKIFVTIYGKLEMTTSWFAHLRCLDMTVHDVSADPYTSMFGRGCYFNLFNSELYTTQVSLYPHDLTRCMFHEVRNGRKKL